MSRHEHYRRVAEGIASYLADRQLPDGAFPGPDNYGVASSLWLWSCFPGRFPEQVARAWRRLQRAPPETHGEFNIYALLQCREMLGPTEADVVLRRIPFGRRHSANWMLLRAVCRAHRGPILSPFASWFEARAALLRYARHGLICDRPGVRSFPYHAFCGALLADLWRLRRFPWAARAAVRAADFILPFILPNGDALYLGRGQQHIFGYGALIYLLEAASQLTGRPDFLSRADFVFRFLLRFQRRDGSFPLVLTEDEPPEPWLPNPSLPGWYSYNCYADYLPFLGCLLFNAAAADLPALGDTSRPQRHPTFFTWECPRYTAVLAQPGGAPTNDLAFPYLCVGGESLFPCWGGEGEEIAPEAMPLPYGSLASGPLYSFRQRLRYRLRDCVLSGADRLLQHTRRFQFEPNGFTCRDEIVFRRPCAFSTFVSANFLFRRLQPLPDGNFETSHHGAEARLRITSPALIHADVASSASGPLVALRHTRGPLRVKSGDRLSVELRVDFP